ncbi:MAG: hypothetical protein PCFJNLEI_01514 [Verrucomicrobiae bacterium]|nr:hypothetical protein [Verrucomicrobiae bacterium]
MALYDSGARFDAGASYDALAPAIRSRSMKSKVALGLFELNAGQTVQLGQDIHTAMTGNANFPTPTPDLAQLQTRLTATVAKINQLSAAQDTLALYQTERDNALRDLRETLTNLGLYVENAANGDEEIIRSAAMNVRANPNPRLVGQVQNVRLSPSDHEGELIMDYAGEEGTRMYQVQVCVDATTMPVNWQDKLTTTKTRCRLNDTLVSGQRVWARVRALGANNTGAWSEPAVKTVP